MAGKTLLINSVYCQGIFSRQDVFIVQMAYDYPYPIGTIGCKCRIVVSIYSAHSKCIKRKQGHTGIKQEKSKCKVAKTNINRLNTKMQT